MESTEDQLEFILGEGATPEAGKDEDSRAEAAAADILDGEEPEGDPGEEAEGDEEEKEEGDDEEKSEEELEAEREKGNLHKALVSERDGRKSDRERYRTQADRYEEMLSDPQFLADRYDALEKARAEGKSPSKAAPAEIPEAPYYPNTDGGHDRMQRDVDAAIVSMTELSQDGALAASLKAIVREGNMSYVQAAKELRAMLDRYGSKAAAGAKAEGKEQAMKEAAKKARMNTAARPRSGAPTKRDMIDRDLKSKSETVRMNAAAELIGL